MIIISLLALLASVSVQLPQICSTVLTPSASTADELSRTKQCFSHLISTSQFQSIQALEQMLTDEEEKIMEGLIAEEIKRLEAIKALVITSKTTCEPVMKWAQNYTHIFIAVKLSNRWDSPPCLRTIEEKYQIVRQKEQKEGRKEGEIEVKQWDRFVFNNLCLVSQAQIRYYFQSGLYNKSKGALEAKLDGVGTYTLTFQKQQPGIWPFIFSTSEMPSSATRIQIWSQLMSRNQTLLDEFEQMHRKIEAANALINTGEKTLPKNQLYIKMILAVALAFFFAL